MTLTDPHISEARQFVDEMTANGATFHYRPSGGSLPASFTYELAGAGDRQKCRAIVAKAKASPMVWAAVIAEIAARSTGAL